jgi:hypothetical protein
MAAYRAAEGKHPAELAIDLFHRRPALALMAADVLNESLDHEKYLGTSIDASVV